MKLGSLPARYVPIRLNAIAARVSQTALAVKDPEGRWAAAESFRSALTWSGRTGGLPLIDIEPERLSCLLVGRV